MKIVADWINNPGTQKLCDMLQRVGYKALFVGGCVRNELLGLPVDDIDIATDARPDAVIMLAKAEGFRAIPTGIAHGTVTIIADALHHEVTTFRRDVTTDGRHAEVAFSTDLLQDAARRDFTINALYADATGVLLDPLGGLPDLLARRIRFVGDANARIVEDHLRILRFFRFHALFADPAGGMDAEGLAACAANSPQVNTLSRERIGAEMRKLLAARNPALAVGAMAACGVLAQVLPGADPSALAPLVHLESSIAPRWQRRMAVLGGGDVATRLCLSRSESRDVAAVKAEASSTLSAAALGWKLGEVLAMDGLLCRAALMGVPLSRAASAEIERGASAILPISASDLMPTLQGVALGARLKQIEQAWLASDLQLSRAELLG